mmetsp:Transcript_78334/g.254489  ORF Transcript_78334/g.254489 Transcript_78334/m.254489 type:complete len:215 (-) Transcript_78334:3628-4272(-)
MATTSARPRTKEARSTAPTPLAPLPLLPRERTSGGANSEASSLQSCTQGSCNPPPGKATKATSAAAMVRLASMARSTAVAGKLSSLSKRTRAWYASRKALCGRTLARSLLTRRRRGTGSSCRPTATLARPDTSRICNVSSMLAACTNSGCLLTSAPPCVRGTVPTPQCKPMAATSIATRSHGSSFAQSPKRCASQCVARNVSAALASAVCGPLA